MSNPTQTLPRTEGQGTAASPAAHSSPTAAAPNAATARPNPWQRAPWLREPLLHFLLLGAALFGLDHLLASRAEDPHVIVISAAVDQEARQLFKASRGREPSADELAALRRTWLDNEVLYREGLALQVDRGDVAIRERVIFKALSVVDSNVRRPPASEQVLRDWFNQHRAKYDEPARIDFHEAVLAGDSSESNVRAFVEQLNKGSGGELNAGLRSFKGRPSSNLVQSYGAEFAKALEAGTPGEWRALASREGWRAVRLDSLSAAKPANFELLRNVVAQDWTDFVMSEQRTQAVRTLAKKYTVRDEVSKP